MIQRSSYIKSVIYDLKHTFGVAIDLYSATTNTVNRATGVKSVVTSKLTVKRAIPFESLLKQSQQISGAFDYGGFIRIGDKGFLIDASDITIDFDDFTYCVYNSKRYDIVDKKDFDGFAWMLRVRETQQAKPYQEVNVNVNHYPEVIQEVDDE